MAVLLTVPIDRVRDDIKQLADTLKLEHFQHPCQECKAKMRDPARRVNYELHRLLNLWEDL